MNANPVTVEELLARGMSDRLEEIIGLIVGEILPPQAKGELTLDEMWALGFGPPCPCGERGMMPSDTIIDTDDGETCSECAAWGAAEPETVQS